MRPYTYDDVVNDTLLLDFNLAVEDRIFKIPYAIRARNINPSTTFFASAWSAPGWMKTNGVFEQFGKHSVEQFSLYIESTITSASIIHSGFLVNLRLDTVNLRINQHFPGFSHQSLIARIDCRLGN